MNKLFFTLILTIMFCPAIFAQEKITEVKLNIFPESGEIRPNETATIQIQFFGEKKTGIFDRIFSGGSKDGTLNISDWMASVGNSSGWLSKPFLLQENSERTKTGLDNLIKQGRLAFAAKDSVLFTAPEKSGTYSVKFTRGQISKEISINVSAAAKTLKMAEKTNFPINVPSSDRYFGIVEHYAPFIAQETWFEPKADYLARFDYDGNWKGDDNWENLEMGSSQAFVYYAAMETKTHWFLIYNFFHPRDYSDFCVVGSCHENDNEGLLLTVRKDGTDFGKPEIAESLAHNSIHSFTNDSNIKTQFREIEGKIEYFEKSRPIIFIEAGGHGIYSSGAAQSLFMADRLEFKETTGVTYVYKGKAEQPKHANDRNVGYALLPIYNELWSKGNQKNSQSNETFDEFFVYQPFGGRPKAAAAFIAGAFHGRTANQNMARPFWAWYDGALRKRKTLNTGQWMLDPAYSVSQNFNFPNNLPFSLEYIYNPFLDLKPTR